MSTKNRSVAGVYKTRKEAQKVARMLESVSRTKGSLKVGTRYVIEPRK